MKIKLLSIVTVCLAPFFATAQWSKLSIPTTKDMKTLYFLNNDLGYVAGKDGLMYKTTNGGTSWTSLSTSFGEDINAMFFVDANTGWITGKDGKIKKSNDGGSTWTSMSTGTSKDINSIHFVNANKGIAVGKDGVILNTSNGGSTWTVTYLGGEASGSGSGGDAPKLLKVQMVNTTTAYVSGEDGFFAVSNDGGSNWLQQTTGTTSDLEGMHFTAANNGYVCYKTGGVKRTNGSGTFNSVTAATSKDLNSIYFIAAEKGWTVGDEGRIQYTENGGSTWTAQNISSVTNDLNNVHFPTENIGYIVGDDGVVLKYNKDNTPPASVQKVDAAQLGILIAPNPIQGNNEINIEFNNETFKNKTIVINVYNVLGQRVYAQNVLVTHSVHTIATQDWAQGVYHITFQLDNQLSTTKIVK